MLQAHHLLDANDRVSPGATAPKGAIVNTATCDFVFGTADEVDHAKRWLQDAAKRVAHGSV